MTATATLPFASLVSSKGSQHPCLNEVSIAIWSHWYAARGQSTKVVRHAPTPVVEPEFGRAWGFESEVPMTELSDAVMADEVATNDEMAMQAEVDAMEAQFEKVEDERFGARLTEALLDCGVRELRGLTKGRFNAKALKLGKAEVVAKLVQIVMDDPTNVNDILATAGLPTFSEA